MELVTYGVDAGVSVIRMDDGRVNALSPAMLRQLDRAFDQAERDGHPVVLIGRPGVLSAGFDLKVMGAAGVEAWRMIQQGFRLASRMLAHPRPVVVACTGHAMAMGCFLLLAGDERLAAAGDYKIQANEVAVGMTLPYTATALCRWRLARNEWGRATLLSHVYTPQAAVQAGFVDQVVPAVDLEAASIARALELGALDPVAHRNTKRRARRGVLMRLRWLRALDGVDLALQGLRGLVRSAWRRSTRAAT